MTFKISTGNSLNSDDVKYFSVVEERVNKKVIDVSCLVFILDFVKNVFCISMEAELGDQLEMGEYLKMTLKEGYLLEY